MEMDGIWELVNIQGDGEEITWFKDLTPKDFWEEDQVFLFKSHLKLFLGKLKSHWLGPFVVKRVFPYRFMELEHLERVHLKWMGNNWSCTWEETMSLMEERSLGSTWLSFELKGIRCVKLTTLIKVPNGRQLMVVHLVIQN